MRKVRFTEEQIFAILKESEAGVPTGELIRRHGISSQTFYNWRKKYGGLEVSEAKRLKRPEEENGRLLVVNRATLYNKLKAFGT